MNKVVVVSTVGLIYDGITSVVVSYLEAMNLNDLDIYVVSTIKSEPKVEERIKKLGCHIIKLPSRKEETEKYFRKLVSFLRRNKIDVIHAHGNSATLAVEMAAGLLGGCKKRIAHSHNTKCSHVKADRILRPLFDCLYTDALACGKDAGKWLFGNRPFTIIQNGRNVNKYSYNENVRIAMQQKLLLKDELVIGHVGGFFEQKNHEYILKIYRSILQMKPHSKLILIGDGPLRKDIEENAKDLGEHVVFIGLVDNVEDYLQVMDGMLLPSLFEGLPLVSIEWQINGLPCILSDTITRDCAFTDNVKFLSLNLEPKIWAESIIKMVEENNRLYSSNIGTERVTLSGFNILQEADKLHAIYVE